MWTAVRSQLVGVTADHEAVQQINWPSLEPGTVEDILAQLLIRRHPGTIRIDGSGGDDGADVVLEAGDGSRIWEIKSFASTLSTKQKRQITTSHRTAIQKRSPVVAWELVIPKDPTPAEERWFADLKVEHPGIPMTWFGLAQIELALADHPEFQRCLLPNSPENLALDRLRQMKEEKASLGGGVWDVMARAKGLRGLSDVLDPDYRLEFAQGAMVRSARAVSWSSIPASSTRSRSPGRSCAASSGVAGWRVHLPASSHRQPY